MKEILLFVNPYSGKKNGLQLAKRLAEYIEHFSNYSITKVVSESVGFLSSYIHQNNISNFHILVIIGGDGTMSEVADALLKKGQDYPPVLLLPAGSGNAYNHDIDNLDFEKSLVKIVSFETSFIDILELSTKNTQYFSFNIIGWGLVAQINQKAENLRWLLGLRYTVAALINIFKNPVFKAKLSLDGKTIADDFSFILVSNTKFTGKGMKMAPLASLTDGLVDVVFVKYLSISTLLKVFPKIFSGKHIESKHVNYVQCKEVEIMANESSLVIDGEIMLETPIKIKVLNNKLKVAL